MLYALVRQYESLINGDSISVDLFSTKEAAIEQMRKEYNKRIELDEYFEKTGKTVGNMFIDEKYDPSDAHHVAEAIVVVMGDNKTGERYYEGTAQWNVFEVIPDEVMTNIEDDTITTRSEDNDNLTRSILENRIKESLRISRGHVVEFGRYPQTGNGKVLPIKWSVLDEKDNDVLLLSVDILDCHRYDNGNNEGKTTWENSELRDWLNTHFFDSAFSDAEKNHIIDNPIRGTKTADKVFILNRHQSEILFRKNTFECGDYQKKRAKTISAYADKNSDQVYEKLNGVSKMVQKSYLEHNKWLYNNAWWLRTGYRNIRIDGKNQICVIGPDGYLGCVPEDRLDVGVCPAIWVEKSCLKRIR